MRNILRPANRAVLAHFAASNVLLGLDFDGTLAPISVSRDSVAMRSSTAGLLQRACTLFPCAIVTGRSRADVTGRLGAAKVAHVIGNHGLEPSDDQQRFERWATRAMDVLSPRLAEVEGIDLESKQYSVSVHYRQARSPVHALQAIMGAVDDLPERPRVVGGKLVVNLVPADAPHKGSALGALMQRQGMERLIYIGDDETDEDVFASGSPTTLLGVRVESRSGSAAGYYIPSQAHIDELLEALIVERARKEARGA